LPLPRLYASLPNFSLEIPDFSPNHETLIKKPNTKTNTKKIDENPVEKNPLCGRLYKNLKV
jgi:hypothetical protein